MVWARRVSECREGCGERGAGATGRSLSHPVPPAAERILASGSVQLPRFTLLESGSLLVSPTHISDAGTYTCLATNSRGADEASADLVVWGECAGRVLSTHSPPAPPRPRVCPTRALLYERDLGESIRRRGTGDVLG